jgi:hypothetical protein
MADKFIKASSCMLKSINKAFLCTLCTAAELDEQGTQGCFCFRGRDWALPGLFGGAAWFLQVLRTKKTSRLGLTRYSYSAAIKAETIAIQHKVVASSMVEGAAGCGCSEYKEDAFESSFRDYVLCGTCSNYS